MLMYKHLYPHLHYSPFIIHILNYIDHYLYQVETQNWVLKKMLETNPIGMDPFAQAAFEHMDQASPGTAGSGGLQGSSHAPSGSSGPRI